jgi:hypothetical protein
MVRDFLRTNAVKIVKLRTISCLVEVRLSPTSAMRHKSVEDAVKQLLEDETGFFAPSEYTGWNEHPTLASNVQRVQLAELPSKAGPSTGLISTLPKHLMVRWVLRSQVTFVIYVYQCSADSPTAEYTKDDNEDVMAADDRVLPAQEWEGLWESLIYADDIKTRLLNYIYTTLVFSDANIPRVYDRLHNPIPGFMLTSIRQKILYLGIDLYYYMVHRAQERPLWVGSHK